MNAIPILGRGGAAFFCDPYNDESEMAARFLRDEAAPLGLYTEPPESNGCVIL